MISATDHTGLTARTFLVGNPSSEGAPVLRHAFAEHGVPGAYVRGLKDLTENARNAATDAFTSATEGMLEFDFGDMVMSGWRMHKRLIAAADATLRTPGRQEIVQLGSHQITSIHRPTIDLLVNGVRMHTFRFRLTMVVEVEVAAAIIRSGKLVALKVGDASLAATLALDSTGGDIQIAHQERNIDLNRIIRLAQGIPLMAPSAEFGVTDNATVDLGAV